jgi:flagellar protein FlaJ
VYFGQRDSRWILGASLTVGLVVFILILISGIYVPTPPYWIPTSQTVNNGFALAIVLLLSAPAAIEFINSRWLHDVERNIPILLKDVAEGVESGVPLITALEDASKRDFGPISKPLEKSLAMFTFTSDIQGSLHWLGESLKRPIAKKMTTVLTNAYYAGGRINDVLNTSVDLFSSLSDYREERRGQTGPYVLVVYIGTAVFLAVSWVLLTQFLAPLVARASDPLVAQSGMLKNVLDVKFYKSILFWACSMESILGGLVAGKISDGRVAAGLIHSVLLLLMTLAFFNSFVI